MAAVELKNVSTYFADNCIHKNLSLTIPAQSIFALVGGSGAGKTTLLRNILMLQSPTSGSIHVLDQDILNAKESKRLEIQRKMGVMFQQGALFSSMTVQENIAFPLTLHSQLNKKLIQELALLKLALVGLPRNAAKLYPKELSGGMIKRAAVARAIAVDPELLFLDEPTAGLDPQGASELDELILELKATLGLTVIMVTHDLDTLWRVTDQVGFLGEKKVIEVAPMQKLCRSEHPLVKAYFSGPRSHAAAYTEK